MRFSQIVLAASSAALSQAVFISNDASAFQGLTVGVSVAVTFADSVGPTDLYEASGTGNDVTGRKLVGCKLKTQSQFDRRKLIESQLPPLVPLVLLRGLLLQVVQPLLS